LAHEGLLKRVAPVKAASYEAPLSTCLLPRHYAFVSGGRLSRAAAGNADEARGDAEGGGRWYRHRNARPPASTLVEVIRRDPALAKLPVIAPSFTQPGRRRPAGGSPSSTSSPFDRSGLLAALGEAMPSFGAAA
jgi:hypothetical protein